MYSGAASVQQDRNGENARSRKAKKAERRASHVVQRRVGSTEKRR